MPIHHPVPAHRGFTLIELMLAVALSTLLLLVAFVTFRAVTRTIKELQDLAATNRILRTGYLQATKDADYWHSHADPRYPYLREHNGITTDEDSVYDVRPFRRVEWESPGPGGEVVAENPAWAQPHDERCWYRNGLLPNVTTGNYVFNTGTGRCDFQPDFYCDGISASASTDGVRPLGWESWHVVGDYAALSNIDQTDWRGQRPRQQWEISRQLGTRGLLTYLHPGALTLIQASSTNERVDNYLTVDSRVDTHFRKGEIPWSLNFTNDLVTVRKMFIRQGEARGPADFSSYPGSFRTQYPQPNRGNYALTLPTRFDGSRNEGIALPFLPLVCDFQTMCSDTLAKNSTRLPENLGSGTLYPMAMLYPTNPLRKTISSTTYDWNDYLYDVYRPLTVIDLTQDRSGDDFLSGTTTAVGKSRPMDPDTLFATTMDTHTHTTWHLPDHPTDAMEVDLERSGIASDHLSTSIVRYLYSGDDLAQCRIIHRDIQSNRSSTLRLRVLTTSYRGARQYWGRVSGRDGLEVAAGRRVKLGDWYGR